MQNSIIIYLVKSKQFNVGSVIVPYFVVQCLFVLSSFAIILIGKSELVALLCLSSLCLVTVL